MLLWSRWNTASFHDVQQRNDAEIGLCVPLEGMDSMEEVNAVVSRPFDFFSRTDPAHILNLIQAEHPQTIALILSYLEPNKASVILKSLPHREQSDITRRIATINANSAKESPTISFRTGSAFIPPRFCPPIPPCESPAEWKSAPIPECFRRRSWWLTSWVSRGWGRQNPTASPRSWGRQAPSGGKCQGCRPWFSAR